MTTLINSGGKVLTYTNEFIETILLQLNSSNDYYTTGGDDIIFIKMGSNKVLLFDYTYHIKRIVFQNYTINENTVSAYGLEFISNNTSNEYTLQGVYNANSHIGSITDLSQVFLAIYATTVSPQTYTGSENIDITSNGISLSFPLKINGEMVLNPRNSDGAVFEMSSGTDNFTFLQNTFHGGAPIAQLYSSTKVCTFHGGCQIPNMYNKTSVDILIADIYNYTYTKTEIDLTLSGYTNPIDLHNGFYGKAKASITLDTYYNITEIQANCYDKVATGSLCSNIDLSNYYSKIEVDDIDNELSTLILNTYTETKNDTQLAGYTSITYLQGNYTTTLSIPGTLMNNYASLTLICDIFYDKLYVDNQFSLKADASNSVTTNYLTTNYTNTVDLPSVYYNKTETGNMLLSYSTGSYVGYNLYTKTDTDNLLANKVSTTGDATISGNLESQRLAINKPSNDDDIPLQTINNNQNWFVASLESTTSDGGCLMQWITPASSTHWWSGVWGTNTNEFNIWFNYKGLSTKPTGDAVISGNLDVGVGATSSMVKAHANHAISTGFIQMEAKYQNQSF